MKMSINVSFEASSNLTHFITNGSIFVNAATSSKDNHVFCPIWVVYGFLAIFFFGSCANLLEGFAMLRSKKNGVMSILLQINLIDTISAPSVLLEISTSYHQTWNFSSQTCMLFNGTNILTNTLIIYLIICLNFHIITFWNLHYVETVRNNRNPLTSSFNNDDSSSSECLVTRIVNIDYRKRKTDIPVAFPVMLLWILSLSISMPKYVLSSTVEIENRTLCVIIENSYGKLLHTLLLLFSVIIPCSLLIISLFILFYKLSKTSQNRNIDTALTKQFQEIRRVLKFTLILTIFYIITSYQRHVVIMSVTVREFFIFENYYYNNILNIYQIMLHYCGNTFRGILPYFFVVVVKQAVVKRLFCCKNLDT